MTKHPLLAWNLMHPYQQQPPPSLPNTTPIPASTSSHLRTAAAALFWDRPLSVKFITPLALTAGWPPAFQELPTQPTLSGTPPSHRPKYFLELIYLAFCTSPCFPGKWQSTCLYISWPNILAVGFAPYLSLWLLSSSPVLGLLLLL